MTSNPRPNGDGLPATSALSKLLSVASYFYFVALILWYFVFLMPSDVLPEYILNIIPHTLDSAPHSNEKGEAIALDLALLGVFAFLHSLLARPRVKKFMSLSHGAERPLYMLQTDICFHLQMQFWRNFDGPDIWNAQDATVKNTLMWLYIAGFAYLFTATFALDHFHLFGLTQGFGVDFNYAVGLSSKPRTLHKTPMVTRWHYNLNAHPIMTGWFAMFWITPHMTAPRLLLAVVNTVYILIAVSHFEEKDLAKHLGPEYVKFLHSVPRYVPGMPARKSPVHQKDI